MAMEFEPDAFGPILPNERAAVIARLADLASGVLIDGLNSALLEKDLESLGYSVPKLTAGPFSWTAVGNHLAKRSQITKAPLTALLATDWPPLTPNREKFETAVALISGISVSLEAKRLRDGQSYQPAIARACNALRKLAERPSEFDAFPDFRQDLPLIQKELTALRAETANKTVRGYISALGALLRYKHLDRNAITHVVGRAAKEVEGIVFRETGFADETGFTLKQLFATPKDQTLIPEARHHSDGASNLIFAEFSDALTPHPGAEGKALNRLVRRRWLTHAAIRAQYLPCDYRRITTAEAQFCWRQVASSLDVGRPPANWKGLLYCGLMLTTGRSLDRLLAAPITKQAAVGEYILLHKGNDAEFVFHPTLPTNEITNETKKHLVKPSGYKRAVRYMLPPPLGAALVRLAQEESDDLFEGDDRREQTKTVLQGLGKSLERPLPAGRVSSFLPACLKDEGVDAAVIGLLIGQQPSHYPGLYYTAIDLAQIHAAYALALECYLEIKAHDESASRTGGKHEDLESTVIGTKIRPFEHKIKAAFRLQRSEITKRPRGSHAQRVAFHNLYTLYVYQLLALATGHRPVKAPLERITDFDLEAGFIRISDKEIRNGVASRLAPLPPSAVKQVELYKAHLLALAPRRFGNRNHIGDAVANALSGDGPFLFFIVGNQPEPLRPSNLSARLATVWPLPLNWHRHFLRTSFSTVLRSELLDAMMGHADFEQEPLSAVSGLSVRDLKLIGHEIEKVMSKLDVAPLEGLTQ